jgi:hypothetical protein
MFVSSLNLLSIACFILSFSKGLFTQNLKSNSLRSLVRFFFFFGSKSMIDGG